MSLAYRTPGVYFERNDPPRQLQSNRMDIAGFVGMAACGPLHQPIRLESWTQFTTVFGKHVPHAYLAYAVEGFFANGGQTCYVVRVADPDFARKADLVLEVEKENGSVGKVRLIGQTAGALTVSVLGEGNGRFTLTIRRTDNQQETWRSVSLERDDARYLPHVLNPPQMAGGQGYCCQNLPEPWSEENKARFRSATGSQMVYVCDQAPETWPDNMDCLRLFDCWFIQSGAEGVFSLTPAHLTGQGAPVPERWGLAALVPIDQVNVVAIPDMMEKPRVEWKRRPLPRHCQDLEGLAPPEPPLPEREYPPRFDEEQIEAMQRALLAHCEQLKDRMALLDPRLDDRVPGAVAEWRNRFTSRYAALYYPWLHMPDSLRLDGLLRPVPPSGHVAGIYARVALERGVHVPPANEEVQAVKDIRFWVDEGEHGTLNRRGVNVIRSFSGRGIRVVGARTLSDDSEWRYVNVRRLLLLIAEVLDEQLQWTVFEPNRPRILWRDVDRVVRSYLTRLWQQGMLDGATPAHAFTVTCDDSTNTEQDIDNGRCICEIQLNLPWPAEFIIVRLGKTEGGTEILENGGGNG